MDSAEKLLNDFSSWYWWVSVVFVGALINVGSSYVRDPLDRWFAKRNRGVQEKRTQREHEDRRVVGLLMSDQRLLTIMVSTLQRRQLFSVLTLLVGIMMMIVASNAAAAETAWLASYLAPASSMLSIGALAISHWAWSSAKRMEGVLEDVEEAVVSEICDAPGK